MEASKNVGSVETSGCVKDRTTRMLFSKLSDIIYTTFDGDPSVIDGVMRR